MRVVRLSIALCAVASVGIAAAPASAAQWRCEASAVRAAVLNQPIAEPVVANKNQVLCRAADAVNSTGLPLPLSVSTLAASTNMTGSIDKPAEQAVTATGGLLDFGVRLLPDLGITLPVDQVVDNLQPVKVPLTGGGLPALPVPGGGTLPSEVTVDLKAAVRAIAGNGLPLTDILRVRSAVAYASGRCTDGAVALDGQSRVAGVSLLGQDLGILSGLTERSVELLGGQTIDPSNLDVTKIGLPPGLAPELVTFIQQTALKPALDALPNIQIPATIAQIGITPGTQTRTNGQIVQRALTISLSILGQRLNDTIIGEAIVGQDDIVCGQPAAVAQAALQCTTRRLVLTDVVSRDGRVVLTGAADKRYIGKTVRIFFPHQRKYVASAVVGKDGTFRTTAAMPARELRATNLARYQARIGKERSLRLKLQRRMAVRSVRVSGDRVRISGRVLRPLAAPAQTITISRRVSCTKNEVVARVRPNSRGEFSVTVKAPPKTQAAVYRLGTRVRKTMTNPKTYPTFTLPRFVDLA